MNSAWQKSRNSLCEGGRVHASLSSKHHGGWADASGTPRLNAVFRSSGSQTPHCVAWRLYRDYMLSKKGRFYQGALAEWLTRCPAISLDEDNERHFLREQVFESLRRRYFLPFCCLSDISFALWKRQKCRAEDGASFELFCKFFEPVGVVLWRFGVEVSGNGFAWWAKRGDTLFLPTTCISRSFQTDLHIHLSLHERRAIDIEKTAHPKAGQ
jgi:hypothetical protein